MKRRAFLLWAASFAGADAVAQPMAPLVGVLGTSAPDAFWKRQIAAFKQGLKEAGFEEGRNVALEVLLAEGKYERLPRMAAELVARKPAVIYASSLPSALAVKAATSEIPVVFLMGADPVTQGVVASLRRPGGNLTGVSQLYGALGAKRLEMLRELAPETRAVGILTNPRNANARDHLERLQAAARSIGMRIEALEASTADGIEAAFAGIARRRDRGAVVVADDPFFNVERERIVAQAARHRLPTIYYAREFVEIGGLASYGSDVRDNVRLVGGYAARLLRGEKPSNLPVLQPTKFELLVNLRSARELGLKIPQSILLRADEVIE